MSVGEVLGPRALNRALLARQLLLERVSMPAVDGLERLVGLQAQATGPPPYVGLWTRLVKFDPAELADLIVNRRVVRIALRRGTIHAVSARDALTLRPLLQPLFDRWVRQVAVRLDGVPPDAIAQAARGLLEDEPLTFAELGRRLGERWPEADAAAWARSRAARWRSCRSRRAACGVAAGRQRTPRSRPGWAPPLDRAGKLEELVLRYLAAFGPATVRDAQTWCGLTGLDEVVERLRPRLSAFLLDGFLAATWGQEINRAGATLTVEPLRPLSRRDASAVAAEGRRLLRWTAPHVASSARTVTLKPPPAP
jgi:hypothetical protein